MASAVGQNFIFYVVTQFNPLVLTTVTTTAIFSTSTRLPQPRQLAQHGRAAPCSPALGDIVRKYSRRPEGGAAAAAAGGGGCCRGGGSAPPAAPPAGPRPRRPREVDGQTFAPKCDTPRNSNYFHALRGPSAGRPGRRANAGAPTGASAPGSRTRWRRTRRSVRSPGCASARPPRAPTRARRAAPAGGRRPRAAGCRRRAR